jgi:hypothetical protein
VAEIIPSSLTYRTIEGGGLSVGPASLTQPTDLAPPTQDPQLLLANPKYADNLQLTYAFAALNTAEVSALQRAKNWLASDVGGAWRGGVSAYCIVVISVRAP